MPNILKTIKLVWRHFEENDIKLYKPHYGKGLSKAAVSVRLSAVWCLVLARIKLLSTSVRHRTKLNSEK